MVKRAFLFRLILALGLLLPFLHSPDVLAYETGAADAYTDLSKRPIIPPSSIKAGSLDKAAKPRAAFSITQFWTRKPVSFWSVPFVSHISMRTARRRPWTRVPNVTRLGSSRSMASDPSR